MRVVHPERFANSPLMNGVFEIVELRIIGNFKIDTSSLGWDNGEIIYKADIDGELFQTKLVLGCEMSNK